MNDIWVASEKQLHDASVAAIEHFARAHPAVHVCCFFVDVDDPVYGHVSLSFDTPLNNSRSAMELERSAVRNRLQLFSGRLTWQWAKYQLSTPVLSPFNTSSGDFEFPEYAEVEFPAWVALAQSSDYPKREENQDDFLESNVRLVIWRVVEALVSEGAFRLLNTSAPFLVGYSIHDQEEVILRILNWGPAPEAT